MESRNAKKPMVRWLILRLQGSGCVGDIRYAERPRNRIFGRGCGFGGRRFATYMTGRRMQGSKTA